MTDTTGTSSSRTGPLQVTVGRVVDYVQVSRRRRMILIVGVSFPLCLVVELAANLGLWPLIAAAGLLACLYMQKTAQETLTASAYGTGLLAVGVALFQVCQSVAGGSTEPVTDTVVRLSGWRLAGVILVAIGIWLHGVDL